MTVALDASTATGTVAVFASDILVAHRTVAMRGEHQERLMPAVADALKAARVAPPFVARVVCGAGPGSFTSLRIAASIAKGIAMANAIPLYGVGSLALAAVQAGPGQWLVTLDAMRGEVFAAAYAWDGAILAELVAPGVLSVAAAAAMAEALQATVLAAAPDIRFVGPLLGRVVETGPVDLASWEPAYGRLAEAQVRWEAVHGRPLAP